MKPIDYTGFRDEKLVLVGVDSDFNQLDTLGEVYLKVPSKLDSFYSWIDGSDCPNCGYTYHRFANKKYSLNKDFTGGIDKEAKYDSFYQFSVMFKPFPQREALDSTWETKWKKFGRKI